MKWLRGQKKEIKSECPCCNDKGYGLKPCPNLKECRLISWYFLAVKECIPMNFSYSTTDKTEKLKDTATLSNQWESIDWKKATK